MHAATVEGVLNARSFDDTKSSTADPTKNSNVCRATLMIIHRTNPFSLKWNTAEESQQGTIHQNLGRGGG